MLGAADAAEVRRYAGVLREAVGLLGIGYCAKLLSCCDAGILLEAVGCLVLLCWGYWHSVKRSY